MSRQDDIAVYTTVPTLYQRQKSQWRIAYVRLAFADNTTGVIALATAPLLTTPDRMLRDTADIITQGMMLTYPGLGALGIQIVPDTYRDSDGVVKQSMTCIDALTNFERRHAVEYGALYFQLPFLERLETAYEHIAKHDAEMCARFRDEIDNVYHAAVYQATQEQQEM